MRDAFVAQLQEQVQEQIGPKYMSTYSFFQYKNQSMEDECFDEYQNDKDGFRRCMQNNTKLFKEKYKRFNTASDYYKLKFVACQDEA